ncbi:MAG: NAD(+)/NADH kinase, partial [Verrucomicrobiota bacterium]
MSQFHRVGLVANPRKSGAVALLEKLMSRFEAYGIEISLEQHTATLLERRDGSPVADLADKVGGIVVLGGDGTILWVIRQLGKSLCPIAAINTGTLGFLTCATEEESDRLVEALASGALKMTERLMLEGTLERSAVRLLGFPWSPALLERS